LTIGIISGGVWANEVVHIELGSKETWALITWLVFATYLHARITKVGKVKEQLFWWSRFLCYLICYLGVNFLGLHSYGWVS
jgi:ABC-type transport system involved in cytochrome c biogenesis permease subunit